MSLVRFRLSSYVLIAWAALTVTFWVGAGIAAADGLVGASFAYSIFPFAVMGPVGIIAEDLDRRRVS